MLGGGEHRDAIAVLGGLMALLNDLPLGRLVTEDDEAFDAIYREFKPALLAFCRSRLGHAAEAEDACQEALLRAYRALPRFDRSQRMWPWLATIAARVCIDMKRRKQAVPLSSLDSVPDDVPLDPEAEVDARARAGLVDSALRDLPVAYRRPVYLADLGGWSYDDIARHEQRSVASVRTSLMRGRAAFKARVQVLAEERGMWPLSAILPFPGLRSRFLAWRSTKGADGASALAPGAFSLAQAAVATFAVLTTIVPAAAEETSGPVPTATASPRVSSTTSLQAPAGPAGQAGDAATAAPIAPGAPVLAPSTSTLVDVDGEQRLVSGTLSWDGDSDGDSELDAWVAVPSDCASPAVNACEPAAAVSGLAPEDD